MSSEWPIKKISSITNFLNNKRVPLKSLDREKRQGIYPYYGASGIVDHIDDFIFDGTFLLISEDGENLRSRNTPIAFKAKGKFWVNNHAHILSEKEPGILDYLEYYFSRLDLSPYITGAAQPKLNKANLELIDIPVPPLKEREKINAALNSLRDKIELNRQINQTLEQIAQAIFKSWFVDFDPVKAKIWANENGQDPERAAMCALAGLPYADDALDHLSPEQQQQLATTAALFPDSLEESELGEIPGGWKPRKLEEIIELAYGKALKKTERTDGEFPVYGSGGITGTHNEYLVSGPGIIVGRKGTVGSLYWEDADFFPIDTVFYVKCKEKCNLAFAFYLLQTQGLEHMNTDAAVPGLNRNNVYRLEIPNFPSELIEAFGNLINPMRTLISVKRKEIAQLETLRDTLLPKLLSGELSVADLPEVADAGASA